MARNNEGLDWNYAIAETIDRDLHEKLLQFDSSLLTNFIQILPLISSGYFHTAKLLVESATIDESLNDTREWLVNALTEADDTV